MQRIKRTDPSLVVLWIWSGSIMQLFALSCVGGHALTAEEYPAQNVRILEDDITFIANNLYKNSSFIDI